MDTQSPDSTAYIVNQTELITMALSGERVEAMIKLKRDDDKGNMRRLSNIITFDPLKKEIYDLAN